MSPRMKVDVDALIAGLAAKGAREKFGAAKALVRLSEERPEVLYPKFDFFAAMLGHTNSVVKWNAMKIIANLAAVDTEGKIELILNAYLRPIDGPAMITAAHAMHGGAKIAVAKPELAGRILRRIRRVERATYATPRCKEIARRHAERAIEYLKAG